MKKIYKINCFALISIILLCLFVSCKNEIKVEKGIQVGSVTYSIRPLVGDDYNMQNPIVTLIPKNTDNVSGVPYDKPYRKGFDFVSYSDGLNTYKPGDVFTETTNKDQNENVDLTLTFKPSESQYFTRKSMFILSESDVKNTSLKTHAQKQEGGLPSDPINIEFVTFPGGYSLPVPNTEGVRTPYDVSSSDYSTYIVGLNKGANSGDTLSWVIEDFAISATEVPSALFKAVLDWNDREQKGYEFGFERQISSLSSIDDNSYPYYGAYYKGGKYYNRKSAYDPVCFVPYDSAIVFCNALTEWYNEKYGASLSVAYTIDGRPTGTPIKSVNFHSEYIMYIGTLSSVDNVVDKNEYLPENANFIPHVQGATGFRLPTSVEWTFAALADPNGKTDYASSHIAGFIYPNLIKHTNVSGAKGTDASDDTVYRSAVSSEHYGETATKDDNGTQKAGFKTVFTPIEGRTSSVTNNLSGLYDMSGNVAEWTENLQPITTNDGSKVLSRTVWGGSFYSPFADNIPSNFKAEHIVFKNKKVSENISDVNMAKPNIGLRLCRTVSTEKLSAI